MFVRLANGIDWRERRENGVACRPCPAAHRSTRTLSRHRTAHYRTTTVSYSSNLYPPEMLSRLLIIEADSFITPYFSRPGLLTALLDPCRTNRPLRLGRIRLRSDTSISNFDQQSSSTHCFPPSFPRLIRIITTQLARPDTAQRRHRHPNATYIIPTILFELHHESESRQRKSMANETTRSHSFPHRRHSAHRNVVDIGTPNLCPLRLAPPKSFRRSFTPSPLPFHFFHPHLLLPTSDASEATFSRLRFRKQAQQQQQLRLLQLRRQLGPRVLSFQQRDGRISRLECRRIRRRRHDALGKREAWRRVLASRG